MLKLNNELKKITSRALERAKTELKHVHHIVAKADKNIFACKSRTILYNAGVSIENTHNKIRINAHFHYHLHTDNYHESVYSYLLPCGKRSTYVLFILDHIAAWIRYYENDFLRKGEGI